MRCCQVLFDSYATDHGLCVRACVYDVVAPASAAVVGSCPRALCIDGLDMCVCVCVCVCVYVCMHMQETHLAPVIGPRRVDDVTRVRVFSHSGACPTPEVSALQASHTTVARGVWMRLNSASTHSSSCACILCISVASPDRRWVQCDWCNRSRGWCSSCA